MSFFICQREGQVSAAGNGERNKLPIKRERTFRDGGPFSFARERGDSGG